MPFLDRREGGGEQGPVVGAAQEIPRASYVEGLDIRQNRQLHFVRACPRVSREERLAVAGAACHGQDSRFGEVRMYEMEDVWQGAAAVVVGGLLEHNRDSGWLVVDYAC